MNMIIVFTHNRPKILKRCIMTAIKYSDVAHSANWMIIDDSCEQLTQKNFNILKDFSKSGLHITHITKSIRTRILKIMSSSISNVDPENIFLKSSSRDISGLRNFGLILNVIFKSEIVFFMDDDMISCNDSTVNQNCFFDYVVTNYKNKQNYIVGSTLIGMLDESYIGKIDHLITQNSDSIFKYGVDIINIKNNVDCKNLLWIDTPLITTKKPTHTSAGLIGIKLDPKSIIPFPAGYNEDWIWCLLQSILYKTNIRIEKHTVIHDPPSFLNPTQKNILWEQYGDYIFDFLLDIIKSNDNLTLNKISIKIMQKISMVEKIKDLDEMIEILDNHIRNNTKLDKKQKFELYKFQINRLKEILEKNDMKKIFNFWFNILNRRHIDFCTIISNVDLCMDIKKLINNEQLS